MEIKDLSFLSINNQKQAFPKHFHNTFCISLIKKGIEKLEFENEFFYSPSGYISITNPFELHANPLVDKDVEVSFDTIYISEELLSFFLKGKHIKFSNRQIQDDNINELFVKFLDNLKNNKHSKNEASLKNLLIQLYAYSRTIKNMPKSIFESTYLIDLVNYIEQNIEHKFYLDELAHISYQNKFGFSRKFKAMTGMAPLQYVSMKKIFSAKNEIKKESNITEIAYHYNYTDLAHFSRVFTKYIGVSPKSFQKQLIE